MTTDAELAALDRAAAEKIMGWLIVHPHPTTAGNPAIYQDAAGNYHGAVYYWSPCEDIEQAFEVLEHFAWPQFYVSLHHTYSELWRCDIELNGGDGPVCSGNAETAAEAIVRAALAAVEEDEWT